MKILLTAPPKTGKSTVVEKFINGYPGKMVGILAQEIRDSNNERVGFKSINMRGGERVFMHVSAIDSEILVGDKYRIDVSAIDNFVVPEITQDIDKETILIIDEIGRAQSNSQQFLDSITELLDSDKNILATILYDNEEWAEAFKKHPNVELIEVTEANRDTLPQFLIDRFTTYVSDS